MALQQLASRASMPGKPSGKSRSQPKPQAGDPPGPWAEKFPLTSPMATARPTAGETIDACKLTQGKVAFAESARIMPLQVRTARAGSITATNSALENDQAFAVAALGERLRRAPADRRSARWTPPPTCTRGWDVEFHGTTMSVHLIQPLARMKRFMCRWKRNSLPADHRIDAHRAFSYATAPGKAAG